MTRKWKRSKNDRAAVPDTTVRDEVRHEAAHSDEDRPEVHSDEDHHKAVPAEIR